MLFDINKNEIKNIMGIENTSSQSDNNINKQFSKKMFEMCYALYTNAGVSILRHEDALNLFMIPPQIVNDNYNGIVADYGHRIINIFGMIVAHETHLENLDTIFTKSRQNASTTEEIMRNIAKNIYREIDIYEKKKNIMISDYLVFLLDLTSDVDESNIDKWCDNITCKIDKYFKEIIEQNCFNIIEDFNKWRKTDSMMNDDIEAIVSPYSISNRLTEEEFKDLINKKVAKELVDGIENYSKVNASMKDSSQLERMMSTAVDEGFIIQPGFSPEELEKLKDKVIATLLKERMK